jgi:hypothetical protein
MQPNHRASSEIDLVKSGTTMPRGDKSKYMDKQKDKRSIWKRDTNGAARYLAKPLETI